MAATPAQGIYFLRLDGGTGTHTARMLIDDPRADGGLQRFPDITADSGQPHALWWDSRNDGHQRGRSRRPRTRPPRK